MVSLLNAAKGQLCEMTSIHVNSIDRTPNKAGQYGWAL